MTALTHTQLQTFRHLLQQREQQLRQELAAAHQEQEQQAEDAEDMPPEPDANQTHETADREVRYAEAVSDQQELQDVRAALQRLDDGSYGECVVCGKAIAVPRLQAFPSAKRCIQCQTKLEAKG